MIKVFVFGINNIDLCGLRSIIRCAHDPIRIVHHSSSLHDTINFLKHEKIDIVILDPFNKQMNPLIILCTIKNKFPEVSIIILSQHDCLYWKIRMFHEGIKAYILNNEKPLDIKYTIRFVSQGKSIQSINNHNSIYKYFTSNKASSLDNEKLDLLLDLASGFSVQQLSDKYCKTISSIEKIIKSIRKYFNAKTNSELIGILFCSNH